MRRYLVALVGAAIGITLGVAPAAHAAVQSNTTVPFNQIVSITCGGGDTLQMSGTLHVLVTSTTNANTVSGKALYQPQGVTGVSLSTGTPYRAVGLTQQMFSGSLVDARYVTTYVNNFRMIGVGTAPNYMVHSTVHTTINADGTVTASVDNTSITCH